MYELNCLGDMCPLPIMKLQECYKTTQTGEQIKLITDHSCTMESICNYCKIKKLAVDIQEPLSGVWEIYITKL